MKTVIEMAKEAGFACESNGEIYIDDRDGVCTKNLNSFAELVRADERNSWPAEMEAMERQVNILTDALAKEREACAKVCDEQVERSRAARDKSNLVTQQRIYHAGAQTSAWNAPAIRARGSNT